MNKYKSYRTVYPNLSDWKRGNEGDELYRLGIPSGLSTSEKLSWHEYNSELKLFRNSTRYRGLVYVDGYVSLLYSDGSVSPSNFIYKRTEKPVLVTEGNNAGKYYYHSEFDLIGMLDNSTNLTSVPDFNDKYLIAQVTAANFSTGNLVLPESIGKHLNNGEQLYFVPVFIKDDLTDAFCPSTPVFTRLIPVVGLPPADPLFYPYAANKTAGKSFTRVFTSIVASNSVYDNSGQEIGTRVLQPVIKTRKLSNTTFQLFPDESELDLHYRGGSYLYYLTDFSGDNQESISSHIMTSGGSNFTCYVYKARMSKEYETGTEVAILPCEGYYPPRVHNGLFGRRGEYVSSLNPMYSSWLDDRYVNLETNEIQMQAGSMHTLWAGLINDFGTGTKVQVKTVNNQMKLPKGLEINSEYYLIKNGKNISFAMSYDDAIAQNKIPLQTMGYGMICIYSVEHSRSELPKKIISVDPDPIVTEDLDPKNTYFIINKKYGIQLAETKDKAMAGEFLDVVLSPNTQYGLERATTENIIPDNVHQDGKSFGWNPASETVGNCFDRSFELQIIGTDDLPPFVLNSPAADATGVYLSSIQVLQQGGETAFFLGRRNEHNTGQYWPTSMYGFYWSGYTFPEATVTILGVTGTSKYGIYYILGAYGRTFTSNNHEVVFYTLINHMVDLLSNSDLNFYFVGGDGTTTEKIFVLHSKIEKLFQATGVYHTTNVAVDSNGVELVPFQRIDKSYNYSMNYSPSIEIRGKIFENYKTGKKRATLTATMTIGWSNYTNQIWTSNDAATYDYADGIFSMPTGVSFTAALYTTDTFLFGLPTIAGITAQVGTRVLVNYGSIPAAFNGIWLVQNKAWVRAEDANKNEDFANGMRVTIPQILPKPPRVFVMTSSRVVNLGVTGIFFVEEVAHYLLPNSFTINHLEPFFPKHLPFNIEFDGQVKHTWRKLTMTKGDKRAENITSDLVSGDHRTTNSNLSGSIVCTYNGDVKAWESEPLESNNVKFKVKVRPYMNTGIKGFTDQGLKVYGSPNTYLQMIIKTRYELVTSYIDGATRTFYRNAKNIFSKHFDTPYGGEVPKPYGYLNEDYYRKDQVDPWSRSVGPVKFYKVKDGTVTTYLTGGTSFYVYDWAEGQQTYVPNNGCELAILDPLVANTRDVILNRLSGNPTMWWLWNNTNYKLFGEIRWVARAYLAGGRWVSKPTMTVVSVTGQGAEFELSGGMLPPSFTSPNGFYSISEITLIKSGKYYWGSRYTISDPDHILLTGMAYIGQEGSATEWQALKITFGTGVLPSYDPARRVLGYAPTPEERQAYNNFSIVRTAPLYPYLAKGVDGEYEMPSVPSPAAIGIISKLGFNFPVPEELIPTPAPPPETETLV